jgi:hypothetical protein
MESEYGHTPGGDSQWTITVTGGSDIFRLAVNMLGWQVEFGDAASKVLSEHRRRVGAHRFDEWAKSMLGAEQFKRLKPYFMRPKRERP